jgi:hypothetical protein
MGAGADLSRWRQGYKSVARRLWARGGLVSARKPGEGLIIVTKNVREFARMPDLKVDALALHHDRKRFSCGVDSLDGYLRTQASQDIRRKANSPPAAYASADHRNGRGVTLIPQ